MRVWSKTAFSVLALVLCINSCGLLGGDEDPEYRNTIYANVYFKETHENGAPVQGLIAINYDNPKEFKLLSSDTASFRNIRVSPDGSLISYSDKYATGIGSTPWLGIYDTRSGSRDLQTDKRYGDPIAINAESGAIWDMNSNGFYYTNPYIPFFDTYSVWYYNLDIGRVFIIREVVEESIVPIALIGVDTLLITSSEFDSVGYSYYSMTLEGEYIREINNPYLEEINVNGVVKKGPYGGFAWNDSLKLLAFNYIDGDEFKGYKIALTDLRGDVFLEFGNGDYYNTNPSWTNDGKIIFTEQPTYDDQVNTRLKLLDPETGEITHFFSTIEYPEITGVGNADQ